MGEELELPPLSCVVAGGKNKIRGAMLQWSNKIVHPSQIINSPKLFPLINASPPVDKVFRATDRSLVQSTDDRYYGTKA